MDINQLRYQILDLSVGRITMLHEKVHRQTSAGASETVRRRVWAVRFPADFARHDFEVVHSPVREQAEEDYDDR
jgi:hypothetical protein